MVYNSLDILWYNYYFECFKFFLELSYYSETQIDQNNTTKVLNWLQNQIQELDTEPALINNVVNSSKCAPEYIDTYKQGKYLINLEKFECRISIIV